MACNTRTNCVLCGKKSEGLPHFRFPNDLVLTSAWANACRIDPTSVTKSHKLCCKHFKPNDYSDFLCKKIKSSRTRLKRDRVPTLELPDLADSENDDELNQQNGTDGDCSAIGMGECDGQPALKNLMISGNFASDQNQLPELSAGMNIDDKIDNADEDGNEINYDEYGEEIPAELNNLASITRFIKKKDRRLKKVAIQNRRLKKRLEKLRDEYFDFEDERGTKLPDLCDLDLDM